MTGLVVAAAAGVGLGLILIVTGLTDPLPLRATSGTARRLAPITLLGISTGAAVGVVTRWPVLAVTAGVVAAATPGWVQRWRRGRLHTVVRLEGIAGWVEQLRDRLSAGGHFQTTVTATAATAPVAIRAEVAALAAGLADGSPEATGAALGRFAEELADPAADVVVVALWMWAQHRAGNVAELLSSLAAHARTEAALGREVDAERAGLRRERLIFTIILVAMPVGLTAIDPGYLTPFATARGQVVLAGIITLYALGLGLLARLSATPRPPRTITTRRVLS